MIRLKHIVPVFALVFAIACDSKAPSVEDDESSEGSESKDQSEKDTTSSPSGGSMDSKGSNNDTTTPNPSGSPSSDTGNTATESSSSDEKGGSESKSEDDSTTSESDDKSDTDDKDNKDKKWTLDTEQSSLWFIGAKKTAEKVGHFRKFTATVEMEGDVLKSIRVEVPTASVNTPFPGLTKHLKNADFFDVPKFPKAIFVSKAVTPEDDPAEGLPNYKVSGALTIMEKTKNIEFLAKVTVDKDRTTQQASLVINRKDFGIDYNGKEDDPILDDVKLEIDLAFTAK